MISILVISVLIVSGMEREIKIHGQTEGERESRTERGIKERKRRTERGNERKSRKEKER